MVKVRHVLKHFAESGPSCTFSFQFPDAKTAKRTTSLDRHKHHLQYGIIISISLGAVFPLAKSFCSSLDFEPDFPNCSGPNFQLLSTHKLGQIFKIAQLPFRQLSKCSEFQKSSIHSPANFHDTQCFYLMHQLLESCDYRLSSTVSF